MQDSVEDEALFSMDEEAPEDPEAILIAADETENSNILHATLVEPVVPELTDEGISGMKVAELRVELERRGMICNFLHMCYHMLY